MAFGFKDLSVNEVDFNRVREPKWDEASDFFDWRNHVPDGVKKLWPDLPFEARAMAVMFAEKLASDETYS